MSTRQTTAIFASGCSLLLSLSTSFTGAIACSSSDQPAASGAAGAAGAAAGSGGGAQSAGGAGAANGTAGTAASGTSAAGAVGAAGNPATGGSGGVTASGGAAGQGNTGGKAGGAGAGGMSSTGGSGGHESGGSAGQGGSGSVVSSCIPTKMWGTADPSSPGPFQVTVEQNVGPEAGVPDPKFNNTLRHFNVYRPTDLTQGYCHPIVTWANGTNDQPPTYEVLIKQLASHGFVVVASLNSQTAMGTPLPQIVGVDWMIQESNNPQSALYHHLDTAHIGATGHSQGGAATTMAGADPRITAIAPIAGARPSIMLHGPAAFLCGGMDTTVPCSGVKTSYDTYNDVPIMLGDNLGDTHGSWIGSIKNPYMVAVTGWFRVHLMGDTANRTMFYGANCKLCTDTQHWQIERKKMDQ